MTSGFLRRCAAFTLRGCFVGIAMLNVMPSAGAAQSDDHWIGLYSADLQGRCDVQPLFRIGKDGGQLVAYLKGDGGQWDEAELNYPSEEILKEFFKGKDSHGVSVLVLKPVAVIVHAPAGWRYDDKFTTRTGDFAIMAFGAVVDLQRSDASADDPDLANKQRVLCLKNRKPGPGDEETDSKAQ
ncbi:hypothetical protein [Paraburkholderia tropica]|uniref:hypothetical protein n=2 Tax=Paraburkholderia tropica TaxID=92647 RepID=UPI002AB7AAD4|nr:hypothetical protein [Paraburkholderia tropica]